jgi:hypothetical protein
MTKTDFENLRYGNIVGAPGGKRYLVKQVVRDKSDKAVFIGLMDAVDFEDAKGLEVVSKARCIAYISGETVE